MRTKICLSAACFGFAVALILLPNNENRASADPGGLPNSIAAEELDNVATATGSDSEQCSDHSQAEDQADTVPEEKEPTYRVFSDIETVNVEISPEEYQEKVCPFSFYETSQLRPVKFRASLPTGEKSDQALIWGLGKDPGESDIVCRPETAYILAPGFYWIRFTFRSGFGK